MNAPEKLPVDGDIETQMQAVLEAQRADYLNEGVVSAESRIDRIDRGIDVLIK